MTRATLTNTITAKLAQKLADHIAEDALTEREVHFIAADLAEEALTLAARDRAELAAFIGRVQEAAS